MLSENTSLEIWWRNEYVVAKVCYKFCPRIGARDKEDDFDSINLESVVVPGEGDVLGKFSRAKIDEVVGMLFETIDHRALYACEYDERDDSYREYT
jgi:hypothetical protein